MKALQVLEVRGKSKNGESGSQRLFYRALDIEQIGHVYEGLLDHTAARASEPIVGLVGRDGTGPDLPLYQLESWAQEGPDRLLESLKAETKRTAKAVEKGLHEEVDYERLLRACDGDDELAGRVRPFAGLVRETPGGRPAVLTERGIYVTHGSDRRSTGTHYTPRGLTGEIVQHALDPLVYAGMADGVEPSPGSYVLGLGFIGSPEEAAKLIENDPKSKEVILPYMNGKDLNSTHTLAPSRWVINFRDWPLERAAEYPNCLSLVERKVKDERLALLGRNPSGDDRARRWWQFARPTLTLYTAITSLERVLCFAQTSKTKYPEFLPNNMVFDQKIGVIVKSGVWWGASGSVFLPG